MLGLSGSYRNMGSHIRILLVSSLLVFGLGCTFVLPSSTPADGKSTSARAFSSEVGAGSRQESATKQKLKASARDTRQQINKIIADREREGSFVAMVIRDARNGRVLYQHNAHSHMAPASSLKVITSAAAFSKLGPDYRFTTSILSNGVIQGSDIVGNLYLKGTGDPTMGLQDYRDLAKALAAQGVTRIQGDLILDDTWFDGRRLGRGWMIDDEQSYFAAQISALTVSPDDRFNAGSISLTVKAGYLEGEALQVAMVPANDYMTIDNRAITGMEDNLSITREHGSNHITVSGTLLVGGERSVLRSVWDPTQLVAQLFKKALQDEGIGIAGTTMTGGAAPADAKVLAARYSIPLAELAIPFLKFSNNTHAEILLKAIGRKISNEGSTVAGLAAETAFLEAQGIDTGSFRPADGSGLSRYNLVTAKLLTDVLLAARKEPWFPKWYSALPVAGNSDPIIGGTLAKRLNGTVAEGRVVAKTGSMTGVSSLSGYVKASNGRDLIFSIITNNAVTSLTEAVPSLKEMEDQIVVLLAASAGY